MSVVDTDLVIYGSASMPDDDVDTDIGGAIDLTTIIAFDDIAATDQVEMLSDDAGDSGNVTITGRNAAGEIISGVAAISGLSVIAFSETFERILKIVCAAAFTGDITIRDQDTDTTIVVIPAGVTDVRRPFYNAFADVAGGSEKKYYDKVFYRNDNAVTTLTDAVISENADPSGNVAFALESSLDGSDTNGVGNDRQTAPGGYTFNSTAKNVANSQNHTAQAGQGVWLELTLAAGAAANNTTVTIREQGLTA